MPIPSDVFIYLCCVIAPSTHRVTLGLFTNANSAEVEYKTKRAHFTNIKTYKDNPKVSPFGTDLVKNAGTIDRFGLAFQSIPEF